MSAPRLIVIVDTEEEFDWSGPFRREARAVRSIPEQDRAMAIFSRLSLVPTYVIDHPVASDDAAVALLKGYRDRGEALIGTHLHPWVSPPFEEETTRANSYPGNLPAELELEKLRLLTELIAERFGERPTIYKAGRYGIGPNTAAILARLGYKVDCSVVPHTDFRADQGPDFTDRDARMGPFDGQSGILELPLSAGFAGLLSGSGPSLYPKLFRAPWRTMRLPGIFARTRLLERIRLSPEGMTLAEMKRLTRAMMRQGIRHFCLTYHSPSLGIGHTPYARDREERDAFVQRIDAYCTWFVERIGGIGSTPLAEYARWKGDP